MAFKISTDKNLKQNKRILKFRKYIFGGFYYKRIWKYIWTFLFLLEESIDIISDLKTKREVDCCILGD